MPYRSRDSVIAIGAIALLTLVCTTAQAARPAARPVADVTLSVNDTQTVGALGDNKLSLAEAVRVAGGVLAVGSLSDAERAHVVGTVNRSASRLIRVTLGRQAKLHADAPMPQLTGLQNTVIDGGGASVLPGADSSTPFVVASSKLTIRDFTVTGFGGSVDIAPRSAGESLRDITLDRLDLENSSGNIGINGNGGRVSGVVVSNSRISGTPGSNNLVGVNIVGQSGSSVGVVTDVRIAHNWFGDHMLERIQIVGVQAVGGITAVGAVAPAPQVQNVTVSDNTFTTCPDPCVLAYAALALGGQISGAGLKGIRVINNHMAVNGSGVIMIAGYTLGGASTDKSTLDDVLIEGNNIHPAGAASAGKCLGISIAGDYTDFHAGVATSSTVSRVQIVHNRIRHCSRGIALAGTSATEEVAGVVRDSAVMGVEVRHNSLEGNTIGVQVAGVGLSYTRAFGHNPTGVGAGGAILDGNSVRKVVLTDNNFTGNGTALLFAGSAVQDTYGHVVVNNAVSDVRVLRSTFASNRVRCRVVNDARTASMGVGYGNSVTATTC